MIILGIDTSCDDTAVAALATEFPSSKPPAGGQFPKIRILSNIVSSQVKLHSKYGGVYPMLAKREHQKNLPIVFEKTIKKAKIKLTQIDVIAVTVGPGLEPCLWEGINFALELAKNLNKPIVPVNHIEAHLLANFLPKIGEITNYQFSIFKKLPICQEPLASLAVIPSELSNFQKILPAIGLVVSGGHTELILIEKIGKYKVLGQTRDDAAGECFDKTARILGLGYPGGPAIAAEAAKFKVQSSKFKVSLPRPMINSKDYDFSFSGLKTAVLYDFKKRKKAIRESQEYKIAMACEIQQAIIDVLLKKTTRTVKDCKAKAMILGGGVVANKSLRQQFKVQSEKLKVKLLMPPKKLCLDNGAMVAMAGFFNLAKAKKYATLKANGNLNL